MNRICVLYLRFYILIFLTLWLRPISAAFEMNDRVYRILLWGHGQNDGRRHIHEPRQEHQSSLISTQMNNGNANDPRVNGMRCWCHAGHAVLIAVTRDGSVLQTQTKLPHRRHAAW